MDRHQQVKFGLLSASSYQWINLNMLIEIAAGLEQLWKAQWYTAAPHCTTYLEQQVFALWCNTYRPCFFVSVSLDTSFNDTLEARLVGGSSSSLAVRWRQKNNWDEHEYKYEAVVPEDVLDKLRGYIFY